MTDGEQSEKPFVLTGYSENVTTGVALVTSFDRAGRTARAWKGLAAAWTAALASVFIPVAHFLLVPGFAIAGIVVFTSRIRTTEVTRSMRGTCPHCALGQDFGPAGRWNPPHRVTCQGCNRSLTMRSEQ